MVHGGMTPYISTDAGGGGGSGGGSINIFYSVYFNKGKINADGGAAWKSTSAGGKGCISYGSIASGSYVAGK